MLPMHYDNTYKVFTYNDFTYNIYKMTLLIRTLLITDFTNDFTYNSR